MGCLVFLKRQANGVSKGSGKKSCGEREAVSSCVSEHSSSVAQKPARCPRRATSRSRDEGTCAACTEGYWSSEVLLLTLISNCELDTSAAVTGQNTRTDREEDDARLDDGRDK